MQTLCAHGESTAPTKRVPTDGPYASVPLASRRLRFRASSFAAMVLAATAAVICMLVLSIPAHALPGLAGRGDDTELGPCERALQSGYRNHAIYQSSMPSSTRLLAAMSAKNDWTTVALNCPQRFSEGTVRSAYAAYAAESLASNLGIADIVAIPGTRLDDNSGLKLDADALAAMSLAEDRAGFAYEILAAKRGADSRLYSLSNERKTNAQLLATAVKQEKDPRQKIYSIDAIAKNPAEATDPGTGLSAPTTAVVEMNCALEQLDAFSGGDAEAAESDGSASAATSGATQSSSNADAGITDAQKPGMRIVSSLIAGHIDQALSDGYPAEDSLLLK
ncbi:hypothetical protein KIH77_04380 [Bifidobacterium sp. 82T24]|uniref:hypothetical protein n=1 Tax=Bifidobacterium pluvialisilvae TaxID=2834436 RepID=UPI001C56936B|nr:hypothetical protein [Bifidobacterium pluvialisilvae]MBW3087970.1 hypothetical protein [Bifidobacterium pluvialisilvae]